MENALPFLPSAGWSPGLSDKVELFDFNLPKGTPMTDDRLPLAELAAKSGDSDFLRAIAESVLQLIMEADVDGLIGAGRYERGDGRQTWRNGYRDRSLDTRLGTLNLKIPKMRQGAYFPGFLEPRKMVEKALVAVIQEAWINGVSTRKVDELVQAMGMTGISKSSVSKLCKDIDERVNAFLKRPLSGDWPYLWLDATYLKVREGGRIVSVAAIIAVAVNTDGKREIVGLHIGPSEAEPFWTSFLRDLVRRGLTGVKLVISDAHEGLKAAITRILSATWQRCRVHAMRNALAYVPKGQQTMVAAAIRQAFIQPDHDNAVQTWRHVADQLRARWPKLGTFMDNAEAASASGSDAHRYWSCIPVSNSWSRKSSRDAIDAVLVAWMTATITCRARERAATRSRKEISLIDRPCRKELLMLKSRSYWAPNERSPNSPVTR